MTAGNLIRIMCPNLSCQRILAVPGTARGKVVRCKACGINIKIPMGKALTQGTPPPAPEDDARPSKPSRPR